MPPRKLKKIGSKLDVSEDEIRKIKKRYYLMKIFTPIIGTIITILVTLLIFCVLS